MPEPTGLPTWEERTGGYRLTDEAGRTVRFQHSRFHGVMVAMDTPAAYIGDPRELIEWLSQQIDTPWLRPSPGIANDGERP